MCASNPFLEVYPLFTVAAIEGQWKRSIYPVDSTPGLVLYLPISLGGPVTYRDQKEASSRLPASPAESEKS